MKTISFVAITIIFFIFSSCNNKNQDGSIHPKYDIEDVMKDFKKCVKINGSIHCKGFIAKAISGHFQINDFKHPENEGHYIAYDEIAEVVKNSSDWNLLGKAKNQNTLDKAQTLANEGHAVIAISEKKGQANVAIILEGEVMQSSSWGVNCPNSAFFFPNNPKSSFVGKTLNYAWSSPAGIKLYVRN